MVNIYEQEENLEDIKKEDLDILLVASYLREWLEENRSEARVLIQMHPHHAIIIEDEMVWDGGEEDALVRLTFSHCKNNYREYVKNLVNPFKSIKKGV